MLSDYWKEIEQYRGEFDHVHNEMAMLPFRYSYGKWQSYNSDDQNMLVVAKFLRKMHPCCVLECGTFEARSTEYFARMMRLYNPNKDKTLVTIDVPGCILHMGEDIVTYYEDEGYADSMEIRKARLELLKRDPFVKVIYREGLTQLLLPDLMQEFAFDFIYEDASHLPNILREDWKHIEKCAKKGCIVCLDDMKGNEFKDWIFEKAKDWDLHYTDLERGQVWMQKLI
jgi:hypothetical protein